MTSVETAGGAEPGDGDATGAEPIAVAGDVPAGCVALGESERGALLGSAHAAMSSIAVSRAARTENCVAG